jgi:predicted AAA+ superfamily ATPase
MPYLHRFLAPSVEQSLATFPCVFINGPRQSGKTTLAQMIWEGKDVSYVNFDDAAALAIASASPESFLSGYADKLILDEIQLVPELYRALKSSIDEKRRIAEGRVSGIYILTGSTNILALPKLADALVGRMIIKTLYPLSAVEIHKGKGDFIERLRHGKFEAGTVQHFDLVSSMQKATFPEILDVNDAGRTDWFRSYISTLIQRDVQHIMDIEKSTLLPQLLRLLATRVGGLLNEADLARSVKENAVTTKRYRTILDLLFLTLVVPPWFRNIGKRLTKSPKTYLIDTNMACYMLGRTVKDIEQSDPHLFGHILENFVATELLKQIAEPLHQSGLHHFRTGDGREVDFVIEFSDQRLVGIEVKASDTVTLQDCAGLLELQTLAGQDFMQGCVLYRGKKILKIADKIWALPMSVLWS